jgi:acyl carrier protein
MRTLNEQEKERISFILEDILCCDVKDSLNPESSLRNDLGADSLDEIEICMEVEKEFNISVPDSFMEEVKTVQDLYNTVEKVLNQEL